VVHDLLAKIGPVYTDCFESELENRNRIAMSILHEPLTNIKDDHQQSNMKCGINEISDLAQVYALCFQ